VKKKKGLIIGIVAGLRAVKNHASLIKAMKIVKKEVPDSKLVVIGDGPEKEKLIRLVDSLGLEKDVLFLGNRKDIVELYNSMDVGVLCSFSECLSISLLEGMSCGVPFVATRVGGNPELIGDDAGVLVPVGNVEILAEEIIRLLKDKKLRDSIGKKAREKIVREFSVDKMIKSYEELY
jgi:glycosyltransferase involved in cell wall biosynthesis